MHSRGGSGAEAREPCTKDDFALKDGDMRTVKRPRRYVARHWLVLLKPVLRYSASRDAYVLRGVGNETGPVLRRDRRRSRRTFNGAERRHARVA
jgi:hypothetical protein